MSTQRYREGESQRPRDLRLELIEDMVTLGENRSYLESLTPVQFAEFCEVSLQDDKVIAATEELVREDRP